MSDAKDKPRAPSPVSKDPAAKPAHASNPSGRAKFDSRGNAVWEWQTENGEFSTDVSTQRVKKLEATELSLEETARAKKLDSGSKSQEPSRGFNPYNNSAGGVPLDPDSKRHHLQPAQPATTTRKPVKDLKRLQEWMEMKKRLADQKDDD